MSIQTSAPAKIILVGEHAVVYGKPAIAVPVLSLRAYAEVEPSAGGLRILSADLNEMVPVNINAEAIDNALALTARLVLRKLATTAPDVTIRLHSDIPIASGLGSGAAVSTALARALCAALNKQLRSEELNALVYEVEKVYHGTPSGIDNTVIVYERPVYFVREQPIETLAIGGEFVLIVADTGKSASTRFAVESVRALYDSNPEDVQHILDEIGALVSRARACIEGGHATELGRLMSRNHTLLQQLMVSSPELDRLVAAALEAGALGAKLSGGGRGGNMIALVAPENEVKIRESLLRAGAARTFTTRLSGRDEC
jgi:mevalonate kinase